MTELNYRYVLSRHENLDLYSAIHEEKEDKAETISIQRVHFTNRNGTLLEQTVSNCGSDSLISSNLLYLNNDTNPEDN